VIPISEELCMANETKEKYSDPSISTNYTLYYMPRNNQFKLRRVHTQTRHTGDAISGLRVGFELWWDLGPFGYEGAFKMGWLPAVYLWVSSVEGSKIL